MIRSLSPHEIWLFGSQAKGTAKPGSDIDLLIIAPTNLNVADYMRRARQLIAGNLPNIDLAICTPAQIDEARVGKFPFLLAILKNGIMVYHSA